jgi:hypothetical protein
MLTLFAYRICERHYSYSPKFELQTRYAACDALVLLRIYDSMCCEAEDTFQCPIDVSSLCIDLRLPVHVPISQSEKKRIRE